MKSRFRVQVPAGVLALLLAPAATVFGQGRPVNVIGALHGQGGGTIVGFATLQAAASGTGSMSQFGQFQYTQQATVDLPSATGSGFLMLTFSNGDTLYGRFSGKGDAPSPLPGTPMKIAETMTIQGGTGRFQRATGTIKFDRLSELHFDEAGRLPVYDSHSGVISGTINIPGN